MACAVAFASRAEHMIPRQETAAPRDFGTGYDRSGSQSRSFDGVCSMSELPRKRKSIRDLVMSQKCHVWTAPAMQEESDVSAKRSGAAMYPAFECSRYGRWP